MPLPLASSLLFANALGPLFSRRSHSSLPALSPLPFRRSAGEASSSSSTSSSNRSSNRQRRSRSRPVVDAKASSTPPPPPNNARSFDGEDELDSLVSAELAQYIDPERAKQEQKRLELAWAVRAKRKTPSAPCDCCGGSGTCGCEFCRGSGALTVGSERFCSLEDGCKECPACSGRGSVPCDACKGTGQRAAWLGPGCPVDD